MTRDATRMLATIADQGDRLAERWMRPFVPMAVNIAETFVGEQARVRDERYDVAKTREQLLTARATAIDAFAALLVDVDAAATGARERQDADDGERATCAREGRRLRDVIDLDRLRDSEDAREIGDLVDAADRAGCGDEARAEAVRVLRPLAAREQTTNKLNGPAFLALCRMTSNQTPIARTTVAERVNQQRNEVRRLVLEAARLVGLDGDVTRVGAKRALTNDAGLPGQLAAAAVRADPKLVIGGFFDLNPGIARRGGRR